MEEAFLKEDVKTRLLLAGLKELADFGARDFSLRRAAVAAGVSCAAPYRYFKDKDEYVAEIISYLSSRWELMAREIVKSYKPLGHSIIAELAVANVRFWLAHKNAASVLLMGGEGITYKSSSLFGKALSEKFYSFFNLQGCGEGYVKEKVTAVRALLIGYLSLIVSGELPDIAESLSGIKTQIDNFLFSENL